jgi:hypothetical protein
VLSPRAAALGPSRRLPIVQAAGQICAEAICPYPPGIPVVVPGEEITAEIVAFLTRLAPHVPEEALVCGSNPPYPPKWSATAEGLGKP